MAFECAGFSPEKSFLFHIEQIYYCNTAVIPAAARRLKETEIAISDIILEVHFSGDYMFYQRFRQKFGMTPDPYRKQNKSRLSFDRREPRRIQSAPASMQSKGNIRAVSTGNGVFRPAGRFPHCKRKNVRLSIPCPFGNASRNVRRKKADSFPISTGRRDRPGSKCLP